MTPNTVDSRPWQKVPPLTARQVATLAGITLLALALRVYGITREFWLDEATSAAIAKLSWPSFWYTLTHGDINMALYYVVLRGWVALGDSEWMLRIPSVLFATATVPLVGCIGARYWGAGTGLLAAMVLALSRFHIEWGTDVRAYAMQLVALAACLWFLLAWHESRRRVDGILYAGCAVIAVYTHLFSVFSIAAHASVMLAGKRVSRLAVFAVFASVALAVLPLFLLLEDKGHASWIAPLSTAGAVEQLGELFGGREAAAGLTIAALAGLAAAYFNRFGLNEAAKWRTTALLATALAPVAALLALSLHTPFFVARYAMPVLIPVALLAGGVIGIHAKVMRRSLTALLLAALVMSVYGHLRHPPERRVAEAARYVVSRMEPGDGLLFGRFQRLTFEWYAERERPGIVRERTVWPLQWSLERPGHAEQYGEPLPSPEKLKTFSRIWLYGARPADFAQTLTDFRETQHIKLGQIDIRLLVRVNETPLTTYDEPIGPPV